MKKNFVFILILIVIDQFTKLLIWHNYINVDAELLSGIIFFRPVQNTHFTWIFNILDYKSPILLMIIIQIFALVIVSLSYRYLSYLWIKGQRFLNGMLIFFVAVIICSFVDVVFWEAA